MVISRWQGAIQLGEGEEERRPGRFPRDTPHGGRGCGTAGPHGGSRCHPRAGWRARRRAVEQLVALEAGVSRPAVRVADLELGATARRSVAVAGDLDGAPLPDDVATEADPAGPAQLEPEAARLGDRGGERPSQRDGL